MPKRKALVVGINNYGGPPNDLPSCVNDANSFARLLQSNYGFNDIHTILDAKATTANVSKELDWLFKEVGPEDRVVFYFSGHGYTKPLNDVMEEFLVLLDDSGKPSLWKDDNLVAKTQSLPADVATVILDSCYSGGGFKLILDPSEGAEVTQVKTYQPPPEEQTKAFAPLLDDQAGPLRIARYRRFGCGTTALSATVARMRAEAERDREGCGQGGIRSERSRGAGAERAAGVGLSGNRNGGGEHVEDRGALRFHAWDAPRGFGARQPGFCPRRVRPGFGDPEGAEVPADPPPAAASGIGEASRADVPEP